MILTSKDFDLQAKKAEPEVEKPSPVFTGVTTYKFLYPVAPMGKSNVAFYYKNEGKQLEVIDKEFKCKDKAEYDSIKQMMLSAGFVDSSSTVMTEVEPKPVKPMIYTYGHPDNSPTEKVNGNIAITVDGKDVKLNCKDGLIRTTRKDVVAVLVKKGYYFVKEEEFESK